MLDEHQLDDNSHPKWQPLSYKEWRERNGDLAPEDTKCKECRGRGYTACAHCGSEIDCSDCGGTGKNGDQMIDLYDAYLARDRRLFDLYYGLPFSLTDEQYNRRTRPLRADEDPHLHFRPLLLAIHVR